MKFCWCTISVKDLEKSLKFYQDIVGLPLNGRFAPAPGMEICFLGEGETKVELIRGPGCVPGGAQGVSLGFEVESVDEMIAVIKEKGLSVDSGPFQPGPRIKFFFVKDPDGVSVQFVEHLSSPA